MTYIQFPEGMNEAADNGPGPTLPPGTYMVVVTKYEDRRKEANDQVEITLHAMMPDGTRQMLCTDNLTFSPKAMGIAAKKLRGLCIDTKRSGFETSELKDRVARVYVRSEPWVDRNGGNRQGLKVDIGQGQCCGYDPMPEANGPLNVTLPAGNAQDWGTAL